MPGKVDADHSGSVAAAPWHDDGLGGRRLARYDWGTPSAQRGVDGRMASVMGLLHKEPMPFRVLRNTFLIGTVVALLTTSCVKSASVRLDVPEDHSAFERDDAVTIVSTRSASCIHDSLRQVQPTLRVVSPGDFRSAALPPRASDEVTFAYPMSESQQKLLSSQDFRDRIAPLRLRYLVMVGEKEMVTRRDEAAGQGGLMSRWWTRLTLTASVIDLKDGHEAGQIVAQAEGERTFILLFMIPVWYVETIGNPVCKALGEGLGEFLSGKGPGTDTTGQTDAPGSSAPRTIDK